MVTYDNILSFKYALRSNCNKYVFLNFIIIHILPIFKIPSQSHNWGYDSGIKISVQNEATNWYNHDNDVHPFAKQWWAIYLSIIYNDHAATN